ncbi:hypothetical protein EJD97_009623, partial [Solanum chilense]
MVAAGGGGWLSDLPEPILLRILSKLWDEKLNQCTLYMMAISLDDKESNLEKEFSCLKELLHGVVHLENLELSSWYIELKGWRSPPSRRKFLQLNVAEDQLDFPGICSFLRSSLGLETLVIDWFGDSPR